MQELDDKKEIMRHQSRRHQYLAPDGAADGSTEGTRAAAAPLSPLPGGSFAAEYRC
jgi:hypothetical protein